MTQGLRDFLNLPQRDHNGPIDPSDEAVETLDDEPDTAFAEALGGVVEASQKHVLPDGHDHANAMDKIHVETLSYAKEMMDLGFNIDPARAARMFEVAGMMYGRAIEAKNSKRDAQFKEMKLMLDQRKIDLDEKRLKHDIGEQTLLLGDATVIVADRNEILANLIEKSKRDREG